MRVTLATLTQISVWLERNVLLNLFRVRSPNNRSAAIILGIIKSHYRQRG